MCFHVPAVSPSCDSSAARLLSQQVASKLYSLYLASNPAYVSKHKQMPSTGFNLLAALIASRLCHRIDVYGFTSAGGGRYFEPGEYISTSHIAGLEHWFYREAMSEDAMPVCVYD